MILEISALLASIAFVILAYFIIQTLLRVQAALSHSNEILQKLEEKIGPITDETLKLAKNTTHLTSLLSEKISVISPITLKLLHNTTKLTESLNDKIEEISPLTTKLLHNAADLTESLVDEIHVISPIIESFTPLSRSISNIGHAVEDLTSGWTSNHGTHHSEDEMFHHKSERTNVLTSKPSHRSSAEDKSSTKTEKIMSVLELIAAGIKAWQENKTRR